MNTIHELQTLVGEVNAANGWHEGTVTRHAEELEMRAG